MREQKYRKKEIKEFEERVLQIDRVCRVTKGGQRIRFRALVAIGNKKGKLGLGIGKSQEVAGAIKKAVRKAKKSLFEVFIIKDTISHEIKIKYGSAILFLKPAPEGTSIIAGGTVRTIIELSGIKNIVGKTFGSANKINNAYATVTALKSLRKIERGNDNKNKVTENNNIDQKKSDSIEKDSKQSK